MQFPSSLYGPLAAAAAVIATGISSMHYTTSSSKMELPPYILYSAHPSMPVPPIATTGCKLGPKTQAELSTSLEQVVKAAASFIPKIELTQNMLATTSHQMLMTPSGTSAITSLFRSSVKNAAEAATFRSSSGPLSASQVRSASFASDCIRTWYSRPLLKSQQEDKQVTTSGNGNVHGNGKDDKDYPYKGQGSNVTVVLLGWLGAQQKHLKRYADWYNQHGINAVTFVIPMRDVISYRVAGSSGSKAEEQIDNLATHLASWMNDTEDGKEKHLFFHTFSNTGWLSYGVILERLLGKNTNVLRRIKGCVVDSAPVAQPDPEVWASGFAAAFLQKKSIVTRRVGAISDGGNEVVPVVKPDVTEVALRSVLGKFFSFFLELPGIKKRLSEVVTVLQEKQPPCPQLYFYSDADKVIPAKSVEEFIEAQKKAGRIVRSCNMRGSPHVDHFRSCPDVYGSQLEEFIQECLSRPDSSAR